jgi:DNA-binding NarL/FixJ family response regulator
MIRVLLFEDNKNLREGLSLYLASQEGLWLVGAFSNARDAVSIVKKQQPDVVLMDIQMPHISGIDALIEIKKVFPEVKVLIQTIFDNDDKVFQAICAGASGYILKNPNPKYYVQAINEVYLGGSHLSPNIAKKVLNMFQTKFETPSKNYIELTNRERDVLACMVKGLSYKMIADKCGITFGTVNTHVNHIYEKLHVNSATEAVAKAINMKLV